MKNSLLIRLKNTVFSWSMLLSVFIGVVMLIYGRIIRLVGYRINIGGKISIRDMGSIFLQDINIAHTTSGYDLFAVVFAVLPASIIFCNDYNSGYLKGILTRTGRRKYLHEIFLCSSVAGGLAIFIPCLVSGLFYLVNGRLSTFENTDIIGYQTVFDQTAYAKMQFVWQGIYMFIFLLVLSFLFGMFWSNIGLLVSVLLPNKYFVLLAPFVLYFLAHIVLYRLDGLLIFSPMNILTPDAIGIPFAMFPLLYQTVLIIVFGAAFFVLAERKLKDV